MKKFAFALVVLATVSAQAKDIVMTAEGRLEALRNGDVWDRPEWLDENLNVIATPDLVNLGVAKSGSKTETILKDNVHCLNVGAKNGGGKTPKMRCNLLTSDDPTALLLNDGKQIEIKAKYNPPKEINREIHAEVLATRVLRALGFGADKMYLVKNLACHGCTNDPFKANGKIDKNTIPAGKGQPFAPVAIEDKPKGDDMIVSSTDEGFLPSDMMKHVSSDPAVADVQLRDRNALALLMAMLGHADNKAENQRILCKETSPDGKTCLKKPLLYWQDTGGSFGSGAKKWMVVGTMPVKAEYEAWKATPVWVDSAKCIAKLNKHHSGDKAFVNPTISEAGRAHLAKLLNGLIVDRTKLEALFAYSMVETIEKSATPAQWTDVFIAKVQEINNTRCPQ